MTQAKEHMEVPCFQVFVDIILEGGYHRLYGKLSDAYLDRLVSNQRFIEDRPRDIQCHVIVIIVFVVVIISFLLL